MSKLLTQNAKMKKSGKNVYNFGIPAFLSKTGLRTCPNAGVCASGCYARSGAYGWPTVKNAYEERLTISQSPQFVTLMSQEIKKLTKKYTDLIVRIHDSGDFYDETYFKKWLDICTAHPGVRFYAYTKQVKMVKSFNYLPDNLRIILSFGGKQDDLIDTEKDFHSKVFDKALPIDYVDASQNDLVAALGDSKKIGLIYHGSKKFTNTFWGTL